MREQQQQRPLRTLVDHVLDQLGGRRIDPLDVLDQEDDRPLVTQAEHPFAERLERSPTLRLAAHRRRLSFLRQRDPVQRCEQGQRLVDRQPGVLQRGLDARERLLRRILIPDPEQAPVQLDHGVEGGVLAPRRALRFEPGVGRAGELLAERTRQARLADSRLAADQGDAPVTGGDLLPLLEQLAELRVAADERRQVVRAEQVDPLADAGRSRHLVRRDRAREPFQRLRPQVLDHEEAAHEPLGVAADHHSVRRRDRLETRGEVHRLAHGENLLMLFSAGLAEHDGAGVDADAERQPHVPVALELVERIDERQTCSHGALGRVLVRARVAEVGEHSIAQELGHMTAVAHDQLARALVIGPHDLEVVLGVETGRELRRADEVAEERRQLAPLAGDVHRHQVRSTTVIR